MKILRYEVDGWAGVDYLQIVNPPGPLIEWASAENGHGKTSALEPLLAAAGGKLQLVDAESTVRDGRKNATAVLRWIDGDETYLVKIRVAKSGNMTPALTDEAGKKIPKPREVLSRLFGTLYNPSEFRTWDRKKQMDLAAKLAGPEWGDRLAVLRISETAAVDTRHDANALVKAQGRLEVVESCERVSGEDAEETLSAADEHNRAEVTRDQEWRDEQALRERAIDRAMRDVDMARGVLSGRRGRIAELEAELGAARAAAKIESAKIERLIDECEGLPQIETDPPPQSIIDTAPLRQDLLRVGETNARADRYDRYKADLQLSQERASAALDADRAVEDARRLIGEHQRSADLPIEDLVVVEGGLEWQGRPLPRASRGEGWRLTVGLAVASGHKLLILDNAEAIGPANIAEIGRLCEEHDAICFLATRGQPHTADALILRDGRVITIGGDA